MTLDVILPPLLTAQEPSTVSITGGTHNKGAPPFDFLQRAFLPLLERMGAKLHLELKAHGFYPKGGGEIRLSVLAPAKLMPIDIHERGAKVRAYSEAYIAALPVHIAQRELEVIGDKLNWTPEQLLLRGLSNDVGPGNAMTITLEHANVTEVITGFGERGIRAETVAANAAHEAREYLASSAPVGEHLADQLLLPMALAGRGSFITTVVSLHLQSNAIVIQRFTSRKVLIERSAAGHLVSIR